MAPAPATTGTHSFTDMENMNLETKLDYLRNNKLLKCMNKNELLAEHKDTWHMNGLSNLKYEIVQSTTVTPHCDRFLIDIGLNNHWTDARSSINDRQY